MNDNGEIIKRVLSYVEFMKGEDLGQIRLEFEDPSGEMIHGFIRDIQKYPDGLDTEKWIGNCKSYIIKLTLSQPHPNRRKIQKFEFDSKQYESNEKCFQRLERFLQKHYSELYINHDRSEKLKDILN